MQAELKQSKRDLEMTTTKLIMKTKEAAIWKNSCDISSVIIQKNSAMIETMRVHKAHHSPWCRCFFPSAQQHLDHIFNAVTVATSPFGAKVCTYTIGGI